MKTARRANVVYLTLLGMQYDIGDATSGGYFTVRQAKPEHYLGTALPLFLIESIKKLSCTSAI